MGNKYQVRSYINRYTYEFYGIDSTDVKETVSGGDFLVNSILQLIV